MNHEEERSIVPTTPTALVAGSEYGQLASHFLGAAARIGQEGIYWLRGRQAQELSKNLLELAEVQISSQDIRAGLTTIQTVLKLIPAFGDDQPERKAEANPDKEFVAATKAAELLINAGQDPSEALKMSQLYFFRLSTPLYSPIVKVLTLAGRTDDALSIVKEFKEYTDSRTEQGKNDLYREIAVTLFAQGQTERAEQIIQNNIQNPASRAYAYKEAAELKIQKGENAASLIAQAVYQAIEIPDSEREKQVEMLLAIALCEHQAGQQKVFNNVTITPDLTITGDIFTLALESAKQIPSTIGELSFNRGHEMLKQRFEAIINIATAREKSNLDPTPALDSALEIIRDVLNFDPQKTRNWDRKVDTNEASTFLYKIASLKIEWGQIVDMNGLRDLLYYDQPLSENEIKQHLRMGFFPSPYDMRKLNDYLQEPRYFSRSYPKVTFLRGTNPDEFDTRELDRLSYDDNAKSALLSLVIRLQLKSSSIDQALKTVGAATSEYDKATFLMKILTAQLEQDDTQGAAATLKAIKKAHVNIVKNDRDKPGISIHELFGLDRYISVTSLDTDTKLALKRIEQGKPMDIVLRPILERIRKECRATEEISWSGGPRPKTEYINNYLNLALSLHQIGQDPSTVFQWAIEDVEANRQVKADFSNLTLMDIGGFRSREEALLRIDSAPLILIALRQAETGQHDEAMKTIVNMPQRYQDETRQQIGIYYLQSNQPKLAEEVIRPMRNATLAIKILTAYGRYYQQRALSTPMITTDEAGALLPAPETPEG